MNNPRRPLASACPAPSVRDRAPHAEPLEPRRLYSAGSLDRAFGDHGILRDARFGVAVDVAAQSATAVIVADRSGVGRFTADGRADLTFGAGGRTSFGKRSVPWLVTDLAVQPDGRILVAGYISRWVGRSSTTSLETFVIRLTRDGRPDPTFGPHHDGRAFLSAVAGNTNFYEPRLALRADGEILVGGRADAPPNDFSSAAVVALTSAGSVDTAYGVSGAAVYPQSVNPGWLPSDLVVRADGSAAFAGALDDFSQYQHGGLLTISPDGQTVTADVRTDVTFRAAAVRPLSGGAGDALVLAANVITPFGERTVFSDGPAGPSRLFRFNASGTSDVGIDQLAVDGTHRVYVVGAGPEGNGIDLARLNPDATPDPTFGLGGTAELTLNARGHKPHVIADASMAVLPDGSIIVAGGLDGELVLGKFAADGAPATHPTPHVARLSVDAPLIGAATLQLTVTYVGRRAIRASSLGDDDLTVTGPGGFAAHPHLLFADDAGTPLVATYELAAPGGHWLHANNGTYTVRVRPGRVTDDAGRPVPGGDIGSFNVRLTERTARGVPNLRAVSAIIR